MEAFSGSDLRDAATKYGNADDAKPVGRADVCDESAVLLAAVVLQAYAGAAAGLDHAKAVLRTDFGANAGVRALLLAHEIADPGAYRKADSTAVI